MRAFLATAATASALTACGSGGTVQTNSPAPATPTNAPSPTGTPRPPQVGLQGVWALTFTTTGYSGPDAGASVAYPKGTVQKIAWGFSTTCSNGQCLAFGEASSMSFPGASTSFSPVGAFTLTLMASTPLTQIGAGPYTGSYPGALGCGTEQVSLTVTASRAVTGGEQATALDGTDTPIGDGNCPNVEYVDMHVTGTQIQAPTPVPSP